jgi:hypothetical protein
VTGARSLSEILPKEMAELRVRPLFILLLRHWVVSSDGLGVLYSPRDAPAVLGPLIGIIDWSELKPYLASPPPFSIPP